MQRTQHRRLAVIILSISLAPDSRASRRAHGNQAIAIEHVQAPCDFARNFTTQVDPEGTKALTFFIYLHFHKI